MRALKYQRIETKAKVFILPLTGMFLLIYILPLVIAVYYSLIEAPLRPVWAGLYNYKRTIGNRYFQLAFGNTLRFMAFGMPLACALALTAAIGLHEILSGPSAILSGVFLLPFFIPAASVTPVWEAVAGRQGPFVSVLLLYLWKNTGFLMILLLAGIRLIPRPLYEAAALDGAGRLRQHLHITLPMLRDKLALAAALGAAYSMRVFKEAFLLYGAYPSQDIYLLQHYMNNHFTKLNYQYLASTAVLTAVPIVLIVLWWQHGANKREGELA